jgi:hypothetical protein
MRFLPDFTDNGEQYIERDFLFAIVKTIKKLLPRIDGRNRDEKGEKGCTGRARTD